MFELNNKIALVTGGSRGIGRAICIGLSEMGATVIINYRANHEAALEVERIIRAGGGKAMAIQADTSDKKMIDAMFEEIRRIYGRLDILVNNAGVVSRYHFTEIPEAEWDRIMDTNAKGYFLCGQCAARMMMEQNYGRIINISSISQVTPGIHRAHYCAAKGAVGMLTKNMALDLAKHNITVNSVAPGSIHTDFTEDVLSQKEFYDALCERTPLNRVGKPEDITGAVILLASELGSYITGETIFVDGGAVLV